jgi:8-oxo-dGTP diphosphatase
MAQPVQPVNNRIQFLQEHLEDQRTYTFAIIIAGYRDSFIWVRHRDRSTWELPAGHLEPGETADEAAERELFEETGALDFDLTPLVSYSGKLRDETVYGKIYHARIRELGPLPGFEISEIAFLREIPENLTYPELQPVFYYKALNIMNDNDFIRLTQLPNIGITLAEHLMSAGIQTPEQLANMGTEEVFKQIKAFMPDACISHLYAIEGAIQGVRWHGIDPVRKEELRIFFNQLSPSNL